MESLLSIGQGSRATEVQARSVGFLERCRECKGRLVQSGDEVACSRCGIVARSEVVPQPISKVSTRSILDDQLGSFLGTKEDEYSHAAFSENSTLRYAKLLSDHMGDERGVWSCSALIGRVAEKLSLPAFVKENAVLLSRKLLAERRNPKVGKNGRRATIPAISAYSLIAACRAAGIHHASSRVILEAHNDLRHRVTKSKLLRIGLESRVQLHSDDPYSLLVTVVKGLRSSPDVMGRLEENGVEAPAYFRRLLEVSKGVVGELRSKRGLSPRTVAAGSVYVASLRTPPKAFTQREVAGTLGLAEYTVREFCCWARKEREGGPEAFDVLKARRTQRSMTGQSSAQAGEN